MRKDYTKGKEATNILYSGTRVSRARSHEKSGFISYSGGAPDFCRPYKKKPQNAFVWGRTIVAVYGVRPTFVYLHIQRGFTARKKKSDCDKTSKSPWNMPQLQQRHNPRVTVLGSQHERFLAVVTISRLSGLTSSRFHLSLVPIFSSATQRCSAVFIQPVGIDVATLEQYFDHPIMAMLSSTKEYCLVTLIWSVKVDIFPRSTCTSTTPICPFQSGRGSGV